MKRLSLAAAVLAVLGLAAYIGYNHFLPKIIAQSITDEPSAIMPEKYHDRLRKIRKPVNEGAEVVVETVHRSGVTMEQILRAIDETTEDQAFAFLDELNRTDLQNPDHVFNIGKKHFPVDFDVEIFRKPFRDKITMATIRKGMRYANNYRDKEEFDAETAKSIAKRILRQKEAEFRRLTNIDE